MTFDRIVRALGAGVAVGSFITATSDPSPQRWFCTGMAGWVLAWFADTLVRRTER